MSKILYPFKVLWAYYWFFIFALFFILLYPLFYIWLKNPKHYPKANKLRGIWAKLLFIFTGLPWKVKYETKLDPKKNYVFVSNHFSYLDIPAFTLCYNGNYRFMAKAELNNIPLFSIFFRTVDISVNRSSMTESFKAMKEAEKSLDQGYSLIIYPEGGISKHPPAMMKFKNGPFKLAIDKQVPIVPITLPDDWRYLHVDKKKYGRPGLVRITVHAPIETKGMTDADVPALRERVYELIDSTLKKYGQVKTKE